MKILNNFFIAAFLMLFSIPALAQKNTVVGKWTVVGLSAQGISVDLDNQVKSKEELATIMQKETGGKPDSLAVETAFSTMVTMVEKMSIEFTPKGKGIFSIPLRTGGVKKDTATYTVDYDKGILNTVSGEQVKDNLIIKFEGDYLTMINEEKSETFKVKRIK